MPPTSPPVRAAAPSSAAAPTPSEKATRRKLEQQAEAIARPKSFRQQIRERRRPVSVIPAATPTDAQAGASAEPEQHAQSLAAVAEAIMNAPSEDPMEVPIEPERAHSLPATRPFAPAADGRIVGWTEVHSSGCRPTWACRNASYLSVHTPHVSAFHGRVSNYLHVYNALV